MNPPATKPSVTFYVVPIGTRPSRCNGENCGKEIFFIMSPKSGRMMPIDCGVEGGRRPDPKPFDQSQLDLLRMETQPEPKPGRGVSHFTTCVDVDRFTRRSPATG